MSTFVVPELSTTDFTSDFDELVRGYIATKYSLTDPPNDDNMKIKVGFPVFDRPYCISILETDTLTPDYTNGRRRAFLSTGIEVYIRMERLDQAGTEIDPQLGYMERELQRIAMQYRNGDIPGIKDMYWDGGSRIYNATDSYAKSDWRSLIRFRLLYEKIDISS